MGFYELSGGADFVPEAQALSWNVAAVEVTPAAMCRSMSHKSRALQHLKCPTDSSCCRSRDYDEAVNGSARCRSNMPVDLRAVSGSRVNMRTGPGTSYGVLDKLARGTQAEVIEVTAEGWARIRVVESRPSWLDGNEAFARTQSSTCQRNVVASNQAP